MSFYHSFIFQVNIYLCLIVKYYKTLRFILAFSWYNSIYTVVYDILRKEQSMLDPKALGNNQEQHEEFTVRSNRKEVKRVQYDYRAANGQLFSCVACDLEAARQRRDKWLKDQGVVQ
jgi:hypothetical protein